MKKGNGGGCIAGILAFCFLGGNVFLFQGLDELSNNGFAIIMVLFAICGDLFLIGFIIKAVVESIVNKKKAQHNEDPTSKSSNNTINQSIQFPASNNVIYNGSNLSKNVKTEKANLKNNYSLDKTEQIVKPLTQTTTAMFPNKANTGTQVSVSSYRPVSQAISESKIINAEETGREMAINAFAETIKKVVAMRSLTSGEALVYTKGFYSRDEQEDKRIAERAFLFKKKAIILKEAKDNYYERFGQYAYTPNLASSYDELSETDLRRYLTWRNDYRLGNKRIDVRYIRLYLSELINGIHNFNSQTLLLNETIDFLSIICKEKELLEHQNSLFFQNLSKWAIEFYVLVFPDYSAEKFNSLLPEKIKIPANKSIYVTSKRYVDNKDLINQISSYKFLASDFYKAGNSKLFLDAIDHVFNELEMLLQPMGVDWSKTVFFTFGNNKEDWFPADGLLFYSGDSVDGREVILTNGDKYAIKDGKGYVFHNRDNYHTVARHPYRRLIGYTIKLIENELRRTKKYRYGVLPEKRNFSIEQYYLLKNESLFDSNFSNEYRKTINVCSTEKFREFIVRVTRQYYRSVVQNETNTSTASSPKKEKQKTTSAAVAKTNSANKDSKSFIEWGTVEIPATIVPNHHSEKITISTGTEHRINSDETVKDSSIKPSKVPSNDVRSKREYTPHEYVMEANPAYSHKPEKIIRKDPTIIDHLRAMNSIPYPTNDKLLYPRQFYSRQNAVDEDRARKSQHFYDQAVYMADIEDDFKKKITPYISITPNYEWLSIDQKRCYFTWRTHIRHGITEKTSACFFVVFLSELINNIPNTSDKLTRFHNFLDFVTNINSYLVENTWYCSSYRIGQWIRDYYILNDLPLSPKEFNDLLPDEFRLTPISTFETPTSRVYSESKELLNHNSSYKYLSSIFYKSDYGYLLDEAIDIVFPVVEGYLKKYKISWFDSIFSTVENLQEQRVDWFPFDGLTYYPGPTINNRDITLVNGERYSIKNGKGYRWHSYVHLNPYADAIAYTIKLIENELRKALGFRYKLQPNPNTVSSFLNYYQSLRRKYENRLSVFRTEEYADMVISKTVEYFNTKNIERMIMSLTYQRKKELDKQREEKKKTAQKAKQDNHDQSSETPVVINIDRSKIDSIRKVSEEIQSALIVEESSVSEKPVSQVIDDQPSPRESKGSINAEEIISNEYSRFIQTLTDLERKVLSIILYADPHSLKQLNQLVISNNDLLEAVIDRINEKALEIIEDNIIEFSEVPIVYEDYSNELKCVLQEEII